MEGGEVSQLVAVYTKSEQVGSDTWEPQLHVVIVRPEETVVELFKRCWPHVVESAGGLSVEIVSTDEEAPHA
jgi:hypothetical protein